jgi:hypothetical protein
MGVPQTREPTLKNFCRPFRRPLGPRRRNPSLETPIVADTSLAVLGQSGNPTGIDCIGQPDRPPATILRAKCKSLIHNELTPFNSDVFPMILFCFERWQGRSHLMPGDTPEVPCAFPEHQLDVKPLIDYLTPSSLFSTPSSLFSP